MSRTNTNPNAGKKGSRRPNAKAPPKPEPKFKLEREGRVWENVAYYKPELAVPPAVVLCATIQGYGVDNLAVFVCESIETAEAAEKSIREYMPDVVEAIRRTVVAPRPKSEMHKMHVVRLTRSDLEGWGMVEGSAFTFIPKDTRVDESAPEPPPIDVREIWCPINELEFQREHVPNSVVYAAICRRGFILGVRCITDGIERVVQVKSALVPLNSGYSAVVDPRA